MPFVDLHLHSTCSDGADAPAQVVRRAASLGLAAMALTDHDTLGGVGECAAAAEEAGIAFVAGVEISSRIGQREVHVLGYGVDPRNEALLAALDLLQEARHARGLRILERLEHKGLTPVCAEEARDRTAPLSRMEIARALYDQGVVRRVQDAFDRYLNVGRAGYVPKLLLSLEQTLAYIHDAGGLAFVAHPGLGRGMRKLLPRLLEQPFDGIEAWHISHSAQQTAQFIELARERGLLVSGGSDCHGAMKGPPLMGRVETPLWAYEAIRERLGR